LHQPSHRKRWLVLQKGTPEEKAKAKLAMAGWIWQRRKLGWPWRRRRWWRQRAELTTVMRAADVGEEKARPELDMEGVEAKLAAEECAGGRAGVRQEGGSAPAPVLWEVRPAAGGACAGVVPALANWSCPAPAGRADWWARWSDFLIGNVKLIGRTILKITNKSFAYSTRCAQFLDAVLQYSTHQPADLQGGYQGFFLNLSRLFICDLSLNCRNYELSYLPRPTLATLYVQATTSRQSRPTIKLYQNLPKQCNCEIKIYPFNQLSLIPIFYCSSQHRPAEPSRGLNRHRQAPLGNKTPPPWSVLCRHRRWHTEKCRSSKTHVRRSSQSNHLDLIVLFSSLHIFNP
jgi:hypothetical protein